MAGELNIRFGTRIQVAFDVPFGQVPDFNMICTFIKQLDESAFLISVPMGGGKQIPMDDSKKLLMRTGVGESTVILAGFADDVVKEGRWTYDYFYTTMKNCGFAKPNDDGEWDYRASYAFSTHRDMAYGFFYSAGLSFIQKDSDDIPYIEAANNEKIQDILVYSLKVMRDTQLTIDAHKWTHVDPWATRLTQAAFEEDRALFYAEVLSTIISLRSMDTDFGILPVPKYDSKQENYVTFVNPAASLIGVPIYQKNKDNARRSGIILEAMAYYGHELIVPEFIEKAIKGIATRDVESIEMLDIIFKNRMYDLGLINDWGTIASSYSDLVFNNKSDYASTFKKTSKSAEKQLKNFLKKVGVAS